MFNSQIIEALQDSIVKNAGKPAFCINEKWFTYQEFGKSISMIRRAIRLENFGSKNIGLIANDDIETYASIFAIWLEGFAYVPLHPMHPVERWHDSIEQASIELIISSTETESWLSPRILKSKDLKFDNSFLSAVFTNEDQLAYILFTSGSTGRPKGVPITRKSLGSFMKSFWETGLEINDTDRCLQCYDLTFDLSIHSLLMPLLKGACVFTIPHNQIKYSYLYGLLDNYSLSVLPLPPPLIRFLKPYFDEINFPCVKYVLLGAEASPIELIDEWAKCIPNAEIYNFYGPTEATIYCTFSRFHRDGQNKGLNGLMSIGKPFNGISAIVVDEDCRVQDFGIQGELCISGEQLTAGYLNNPEKNVEVFKKIEIDGVTERFYKTGDLCTIDSMGDILYSGRKDYQVKIMGFRVELGEIEFHARACINGKNAVALLNEDSVNGPELVLFVETSLSEKKVLSDYLKVKLPYYMIPVKIFECNEFPLNSNGKVDRNALKRLIPN